MLTKFDQTLGNKGYLRKIQSQACFFIRCVVSGRSRGVYRDFRVSRFIFRFEHKATWQLNRLNVWLQAGSRLQQSVRSAKSSLDPQHQDSTIKTYLPLLFIHPPWKRHVSDFFSPKMFLSKMLKAADHPMLMGRGGRMVTIRLWWF